jgi:hypothetical protein
VDHDHGAMGHLSDSAKAQLLLNLLAHTVWKKDVRSHDYSWLAGSVGF